MGRFRSERVRTPPALLVEGFADFLSRDAIDFDFLRFLRERERERLKERELIRFFVRSFAGAWRVSDSLFIHAHCEARRPMNEL